MYFLFVIWQRVLSSSRAVLEVISSSESHFNLIGDIYNVIAKLIGALSSGQGSECSHQSRLSSLCPHRLQPLPGWGRANSNLIKLGSSNVVALDALAI